MRGLAILMLASCGQDGLEPIHRENAPAIVIDGGTGGTETVILGESIRDTVLSSLTADNPDPFVCCCIAIGDTTEIVTGVAEGPGPSPSHPLGWGPVTFRALVAAGDIPAGSIRSARLDVWQKSALGTGTVKFYRVSDLNVWAETDPTTEAGPQNGKPDWYHAEHHTGAHRSWGTGGSAGLSAPGIDYDEDPEPPTLAYSPDTNGAHSVELPVEWFTDWRDGARLNNGILLTTEIAYGVRDLVTLASSEDPDHPLRFVIETE